MWTDYQWLRNTYKIFYQLLVMVLLHKIHLHTQTLLYLLCRAEIFLPLGNRRAVFRGNRITLTWRTHHTYHSPRLLPLYWRGNEHTVHKPARPPHATQAPADLRGTDCLSYQPSVLPTPPNLHQLQPHYSDKREFKLNSSLIFLIKI